MVDYRHLDPILVLNSRRRRRPRIWGAGPWSGWNSGIGPFGGGRGGFGGGFGGFGGGGGGGGGGFGGFGGGRMVVAVLLEVGKKVKGKR